MCLKKKNYIFYAFNFGKKVIFRNIINATNGYILGFKKVDLDNDLFKNSQPKTKKVIQVFYSLLKDSRGHCGIGLTAVEDPKIPNLKIDITKNK